MQHGKKRIVILAFRGVGKSFIAAVFVVWCLHRNPQLKILITSASRERSNDFSIFVKHILQIVPFLNYLIPAKHQRTSNISFDVRPATPDQSPSVKSVGITGTLTGSRADIIIADDVESLANSYTLSHREHIGENVKEFEAILKPLETSRIIFLGTPQVEESLYYKLVQERGYDCCVWPAQVPDEASIKHYEGTLAQLVLDQIASGAAPDTPVDPNRFDASDLATRRLSYGVSGYSLQFMLNPILSDSERYPLKCADLVVHDVGINEAPLMLHHSTDQQNICDIPCIGLAKDRFYRPYNTAPEIKPYTSKVLSIDPSGRGSNETAINITAMLNGYIFLLYSWGTQDGYSPETLSHIAEIAKLFTVNQVLVESNFGDGTFSALLNPVLKQTYQVAIKETRAKAQKEKRIIDTLEPVLMQHRLIVSPRVLTDDLKVIDRKYSLIYQLTRICNTPKCLAQDDRVDALAIAIAHWTESLAINAQDSIEALKEAEAERMIRGFLEGYNRHNKRKDYYNHKPNWLTNNELCR